MKKTSIIFLLVCFVICLVPFVGMAIRPTTETTENRKMEEFPSVKTEDGKVNKEFFREFDSYFKDHFAFRNELVATDAKIQNGVFHTSNIDKVIAGTDGWLYYASTGDDYRGTERLSARELHGLVHNLEIAKNYVEEQGCQFLLTVPANKNTLYGENMPYYEAVVVSPTHDVDKLAPLLAEKGIPYANLVQVFREQEETLYLKRDSHWNNTGALLAYNAILDELKVEHNRYDDVAVTRAKETDGDLNRMLYSFYGEKEMDAYYEIPAEYTTPAGDLNVEAAWIQTNAEGRDGTLLMFRDSFGNTLIPMIANQFGKSLFSKELPYRLEKTIWENAPDYVVFENAERDLKSFLNTPPILSAPRTEELTVTETVDADVQITCKKNMFDPDFLEITGTLPAELLEDDSDIIVSLDGMSYNGYQIGENGFALYIKREEIGNFPVSVRVFVTSQDGATQVMETEISEGDDTP